MYEVLVADSARCILHDKPLLQPLFALLAYHQTSPVNFEADELVSQLLQVWAHDKTLFWFFILEFMSLDWTWSNTFTSILLRFPRRSRPSWISFIQSPAELCLPRWPSRKSSTWLIIAYLQSFSTMWRSIRIHHQ